MFQAFLSRGTGGNGWISTSQTQWVGNRGTPFPKGLKREQRAGYGALGFRRPQCAGENKK